MALSGPVQLKRQRCRLPPARAHFYFYFYLSPVFSTRYNYVTTVHARAIILVRFGFGLEYPTLLQKAQCVCVLLCVWRARAQTLAHSRAPSPAPVSAVHARATAEFSEFVAEVNGFNTTE